MKFICAALMLLCIKDFSGRPRTRNRSLSLCASNSRFLGPVGRSITTSSGPGARSLANSSYIPMRRTQESIDLKDVRLSGTHHDPWNISGLRILLITTSLLQKTTHPRHEKVVRSQSVRTAGVGVGPTGGEPGEG